MQWPRNPEFNNPSKYGLEGVRNFYLTTNDGIQLGVWHILPESCKHVPNTTSDEDFENLLNGSDDVVIYNHGNSGHRIAPHRVELYKLLRRHFHVIAYDYRSTYLYILLRVCDFYCCLLFLQVMEIRAAKAQQKMDLLVTRFLYINGS